MWAAEALTRFLHYPDIIRVLDVGSGVGAHAALMRAAGRDVHTISLAPPADFVGDYLDMPTLASLQDGIWASHVLEHQRDAGRFLRRCFRDLRDDGALAITVPPLKHLLVGGHLTLWNPGLLVYNLIVNGFDCREARVHQYGYNISVIVRKRQAVLPPLMCDKGDLEALKEFFPFPVRQECDGRVSVNWGDE
jgi:SAM-dependent methyltransferase